MLTHTKTGGLAGQHRFGARTNLSVIVLGASKLLLGLFLAGPFLFSFLFFYFLKHEPPSDSVGGLQASMPFFIHIPTYRAAAPDPRFFTIYVSSYYYICVLILLYVSSYYYMCPHTTIYSVSSYFYVCVLILPYMRPHTTICVSS